MGSKVVARWNSMLEERWLADVHSDVHAENAQKWFGVVPGDEDFRKKRNIAKIVALGTINSMSPEGIRLSLEKSLEVSLPVDEIEKVMVKFEQDFPQLWR